jgi:hypothetical protein
VKKPAPQVEEVYSKEERDEAIRKMKAASEAFYRAAAATHCHPFIEFTGFMNEYIKLCEEAFAKGVDFMMANTHTGVALPIQSFHAAYIGEKMGCIYGPSFADPSLFQAFVSALDLPFKVTIHREKP